MIKRYFLFLLLFVSLISSVNAEYGTDTSAYKVVLDNTDLTTVETTATLEGYTWLCYTPSIVGVDGNTIYFSTKKDLARFCSYLHYDTRSMPFGGYFNVYINGVISNPYVFVLDTSCHSAGNMTIYADPSKTSQVIYALSDVYGYHTSASAKTTLDSVIINSCGNGRSNSYTEQTIGGTFEAMAWSYDPDIATNAHATALLVLTIWDDDVDYTHLDNYNTATDLYHRVFLELMSPPDKGNVTIYTEPGTGVYENDYLLGTTDNGGCLDLQIPIGDHELVFTNEGYWDVYETITVTVENDTELFISLSPKTSIFQVSKEFSGNLYPNSVGTLSMDITPVKDAYASKLRISGVDVNKVYYKTQEIPKGSDGYYILGDVTGTQNIEIEFETPQSWGDKTFTVELTAIDIEGTAYTTLETINYEVLELPFLLEMPETFGIGLNDITLTDQSGTAYSVLMVLYDSDDVEIWSSSTNLLEYCDYTFEVPIEDAGEYTLELNAKAGTVKSYYSIEIIEPVSLVSDFLTANPGKVATVQFKISNPTESVKYYTAELTCPFFNESIAKTFSIAPGTVNKTVDMSFEVPEGLELEYYQLTLEVFNEGDDEPLYSGHVVLTISESSLLFASVPGGNTTLIILAAAVLLIAGTFAALRLKK